MALVFPSSPTVGQTYVAPNNYTYTYALSNGVGVWTAAASVSLSLTSAGTISGTAAAGSTLTYSTGTATGGISPYTYTWVWKKESDNSTLQTGGTTYVIPGSLVGGRVYVALTATDSVSATVTGNTASYPASPAVITQAVFPNWAVAAPTTIPGITSGAWADGTTSLTSTNCIQISLDGVTFGQGPLSVSNGTTLYMQWEPTGASCGGAASGTTITGTLTDGTYVNSYSLTLDRDPAAFTFTDLTGQALSTAFTSNTVTISGTNSPAYITGTSATLTSVQVSVAGGAFVSLPTSGTTVTVNPGATVQIKGTTGASSGTGYSVTVNMGTTSDTWTVTTAALTPTVAQPSITSPTDGTTGLNPTVNAPMGITLISSAFSSSNGAGTDHVSSDWQVATDSGFSTIVFSSTTDTTNKTSILVPIANLTQSTTYYCRVRYTSGTGGGGVVTTSVYSASTYDWQTASTWAPAIGTSMSGGYYGGQIRVFAGEDGGGLPAATTIYYLIVAPRATGTLPANGNPSGLGDNTVIYKTTDTADFPSATFQNLVYGKPANDAGNDVNHPIFQWARGLTINTFNDWYIPSYYERDILYYNLKPGTNNNTATSYGPVSPGVNPNAVPARTTAWTSTVPSQTTSTIFQETTGTEQFLFGAWPAPGSWYYWCSSERSTGTTEGWGRLSFNDGGALYVLKSVNGYMNARAIRRVAGYA